MITILISDLLANKDVATSGKTVSLKQGVFNKEALYSDQLLRRYLDFNLDRTYAVPLHMVQKFFIFKILPL